MAVTPTNVHSDAGSSAKKRKRRRRGKNAEKSDEIDTLVFGSGKKVKFDDGSEENASEKSKDAKHTSKNISSVEDQTINEPEDEIEQEVRRDEAKTSQTDTPNGHKTKPHGTHKHTKDKKGKKHHDGPKVVNFHDSDDEESGFHTSTHVSRDEMGVKARKLLEVRQSLPIYQHKDEILEHVAQNQVTVIIGETGSGKSTQIPQFLMPLNKKQIAVTQPRRVAAASLAQRVAEEHGCKIGDEVGYQVRFANVSGHHTKLKYLTDGMLLREIMLDNKLRKYTTIIIDEAHERTILTDLIMGFLKQLLLSKARQDLKIIIMSATLNAELFSAFFADAPVLYVEGRMFPVAKYYLEDSNEDLVDTMVRAVVQVNMSEQQGDILCFLPGQEEIDNAVSSLQTLAPDLPREAPLIVPLPLYAALSPHQQSKIFEKYPPNKRKVILATNIAETSITVSGVKYVIDSGLRKVKVWKHSLGLSTLLTTTISQASAKQRAGRAGRETSGKVFRLYAESIYENNLPKQQESEIVRNDIVLPVLTLKRLGVDDLLNWSWIEHPGKESILSALNSLYSLNALDDNGRITDLGNKMAVLPLPPQLSAVLITASEFGVLGPVVEIVACLSVDNLVLNVTGGDGEVRDEINSKRRNYTPLGCQYGDLITYKEYYDYFHEMMAKNTEDAKDWCKELHINFRAFKNVVRVKKQLEDYMVSMAKQDGGDVKAIKAQIHGDKEDMIKKPLDVPAIIKSFLKGYITNTAIGMPDRSYRTCTNGQLISIHPSSNLFGKPNDAIMYIEYVYTTKGYARNCSAVELTWLQEMAPHILGNREAIDE